MKTKKVVFLVFLILILFAIEATAEQPEGVERPITKKHMNKTRERIETLKMWKLTKALDLDEKTSSQLFPLLSRYEKKKAEIRDALMVTMKELQDALRDRSERQIKDNLGKIEAENNALHKLRDEEWTELKKILNIEQQAKYIIFQHEFKRDMWRMIAEARERNTARPQK